MAKYVITLMVNFVKILQRNMYDRPLRKGLLMSIMDKIISQKISSPKSIPENGNIYL